MQKLLPIVLLAAVSAGVYWFLSNYQIKRQDDGISVRPRHETLGPPPQPDRPPLASEQKSIRIATFNLSPLDHDKLGNSLLVGHLVELIRGFDLVAIQDVRARNEGILRELVEKLNSQGAHFDFAVSAEVGREETQQYNGFLFDKSTIEIDRGTIGLVSDPAGRFRQKPLTALFRTRGPDAREAFTFMLVNVHVNPEAVSLELNLLDDVFHTACNDNPDEDDVILLGTLEADQQNLGELGQVPAITCAVAGTVSTTRGTRLADNILFDRRATTEFTGRADVVDLMRRLNVSMRDAMNVARHMPVWAEFSIYEGGQVGQIAVRAKEPPE